MAKAPFSFSDFASGDTLDLDAVVTKTQREKEPSAPVKVNSEEPTEQPRKSAQEVGRSVLRQQKAARTVGLTKYVNGRISTEMDRRLKQLYVDKDVSRQDALVAALEMYLKHKGY